ncbi:DUF2231 domain-containing protein [Actinopolymorpha singaporensis]|uniref:DUF2231 domain-containing protein n=1 Tax=Actinopolymorpha singaporensis TaxID=117157 RepID=A0A1H1NNH6_9ACTN|nr:DUF2231 domain-containing protein [Actinopolymorpha singaporensis]SDS00518.1 hypothetical protein SAMN04489717_1301 [Actinopolymorpha singaporensis]
MPTFLNGLPVHVLIVHATVVAVPLAALAAVIVALVPRLRRRYGWAAVAVAAVATVLVPMTTSAGEGLEARMEHSAAIERHAQLADAMIWLVLPLLIALAALVALDTYRLRNARAEGPGTMTAERRTVGAPAWTRFVSLALIVVTVGFAVASTVQIVRVGDAGSRAAWGDEQYTAPHGGGD